MSKKVSIISGNIEHVFVTTIDKDNGSKSFKCKHCDYIVGSVKKKPKYTSNTLSIVPHEDHGFYSGVFDEEDFANNREVVLYNEESHSIFCKGIATTDFTNSKNVECVDEDI